MKAKSIGLFLVMSLLALAASLQVGLAQESGPGVDAPITEEDGCMQDLAGFDLNCRANDVQIARVAVDEFGEPLLEILDDGCAYLGDTVEFEATFEVVLTAQARHDLGIYFATDGDLNGDGAISGSCSISTVPYEPDPPWLDLDGTTDPLPGTKEPSNLQDVCGDIDDDHNPLYPEITITTACIDPDGDGWLNLPYCTSWRQSGANEYCAGPLSAYPGAPSKCRCDAGFNVPIYVPPAELVVVKTANPTSVPESGGNVIFTVSITNVGVDPNNYVTLTSLVDDVFGDLSGKGNCGDLTDATLAGDGGSASCSFTEWIEGDYGGPDHENTVTASGTDDHGNGVSGYDDATVDFTDVLPEITVLKTGAPTSVPETGGDVTFTYTVTNNSLEAAEITVLSDDQFGPLTGDADCQVGTVLASGASCEFEATFAIPAGDYPGSHENVFTGTVTDDDDNTDTDDDGETITYTDVKPAAHLTKTPDEVRVTFEVVVYNDSTAEELYLDELDDNIYGDIADPLNLLIESTTCSVPQTIAIGEDYTCYFTAIVSTSPQTDTVTADVSDDEGTTIYPSDWAWLEFE